MKRRGKKKQSVRALAGVPLVKCSCCGRYYHPALMTCVLHYKFEGFDATVDFSLADWLATGGGDNASEAANTPS